MIWIVVTSFLFITAWVLLSPFEIKIDTRVLVAMVRWRGIGKAMLVYENGEWWLKIQVLGFNKGWPILDITPSGKKRKKIDRRVKKQGWRKIKLQKCLSLAKSFQLG
jgi:hypothetical protein